MCDSKNNVLSGIFFLVWNSCWGQWVNTIACNLKSGITASRGVSRLPCPPCFLVLLFSTRWTQAVGNIPTESIVRGFIWKKQEFSLRGQVCQVDSLDTHPRQCDHGLLCTSYLNMGGSLELPKGSGRGGSVDAFCLYMVNKSLGVSFLSPARVDTGRSWACAICLFIYVLFERKQFYFTQNKD